jgi:hypothetical protein
LGQAFELPTTSVSAMIVLYGCAGYYYLHSHQYSTYLDKCKYKLENVAKKRSTHPFSPPETKEQLEAIALRLGIFWGKSPSVSGLLVAIAQQKIDVGEPFTLNSTEVSALQQGIRLLIDSGYVEGARSLSQLLVSRGNLAAPLRQSLLQQAIQPTAAWRIQAEEYINNGQPFLVLYRNPKGENLAYTVRYAEISPKKSAFT